MVLACFQVKWSWANIRVKLMTAYWEIDVAGQEQPPKLLDQVRNVLRLRHYSIHTERSIRL
jgi:hypothetical protein